jgi:hypothetical protein
MRVLVQPFVIVFHNFCLDLIPMEVRSEPWVCGRLLARIARSNPTGGLDLSVVCFHIEVSATRRSLVQRDPTGCICVSLNVIRCNDNCLRLK